MVEKPCDLEEKNDCEWDTINENWDKLCLPRWGQVVFGLFMAWIGPWMVHTFTTDDPDLDVLSEIPALNRALLAEKKIVKKPKRFKARKVKEVVLLRGKTVKEAKSFTGKNLGAPKT